MEGKSGESRERSRQIGRILGAGQMTSVHKTVLLKETIDGLSLTEKPQVFDATFGGGGHSLEICRRYPGARIVALDQDKGAWERARGKFENLKCDITFVNANFRELSRLEKFPADGIVFDLGLSSDQLE